MAKLTLYTDRSVRSQLAKTHLTNLGVDFDEVNILEDDTAATFLESKGRDVLHYPVPQYYVGENLAWANGYKDVADLTVEQINTKVTELNAG